MRKPCLEQRGFRRNLGVRGPDFLPPLLWSVYLVTGGVRCAATGLGINEDTLAGSEPASVKAGPSEAARTPAVRGRDWSWIVNVALVRVCVPHGDHGPVDQRGERRHRLPPSGHLCPWSHRIWRGFFLCRPALPHLHG